jgi:hypothetical protein
LTEKNIVSVYMSNETKETLDAMAEKLTGTKQGRSVTLDVIVNHASENFTEIENRFKRMKEVKK